VKSKDILIVVASAVACAALVFGLAHWPMSSQAKGGQAVRDQAMLSQAVLADAYEIMAQPAAHVDEDDENFPFRSYSGVQINNLNANAIAFHADVINPDVVPMLDGAIAPLKAALQANPDAPEADRGFGLMVLGNLQDLKGKALTCSAGLTQEGVEAAMPVMVEGRDDPIEIEYLPRSHQLLNSISHKQGLLALEREMASAPPVVVESMREEIMGRRTAAQADLVATVDALADAVAELEATNETIADLSDEAGRLERESTVTVRADPSKALMDQALALRAEAQALRDARDGIGPDGPGASMAAKIRRLEEKQTHLEGAIALADEQIARADDLLAEHAEERRVFADRVEALESQLADTQGDLLETLLGLTDLAESYVEFQNDAIASCQEARKNYSESAKLIGDTDLRVQEGDVLLMLGAIQLDMLMFDEDLAALKTRIARVGLDRETGFADVIARLDAIALDSDAVITSASTDLMNAKDVYDKLISRADKDDKPRYQLQQAAAFQMLYALTDDVSHRDQAEALLVSLSGVSDAELAGAVSRMDRPITPLSQEPEIPVYEMPAPREPEVSIDMSEAAWEDVEMTPASPEDEKAILAVLDEVIVAMEDNDSDAFFAMAQWGENPEVARRAVEAMMAVTAQAAMLDEELTAKFGSDAMEEFNAAMMESVGMTVSSPVPMSDVEVLTAADKASARDATGGEMEFIKVGGQWKVDLNMDDSEVGIVDGMLIPLFEMSQALITEARAQIDSSDSIEELVGSLQAKMMEMMSGPGGQ
jgi:hypothetical protein